MAGTGAPPPDPNGLQAALQRSSDAFGNVQLSPDQISGLQTDLGSSQDAEAAIDNAQIKTDSTPFQGQPPQQDSHLLSGLFPLLAIGAFAGKATKLDASAMLGASIGMTKGYLDGKQEVYEESKAKFDAAYQQFKDRMATQDKVYQEMREAYKGRIDADIKALEFARQVTQDQATNQQNILRDQETVQHYADQLHQTQERIDDSKVHEKAMERFEQQKIDIERKKAAQATAPISPEGLKLEAELFMQDPTNVRFTAAERKQIVDYLGKNYGVTADDIVNKRAQTKVTYKEATVLGGQKANLERVETALNEPGGVGDQAVQAAAALNGSDLKQYNRISQLLAANVSDPKLAAYKAKMIALRDEYATVINKGGPPTEGSRQQATEAMDAYQPNAVPALVQAIKEVNRSNMEALNANISDLGKAGSPDTSALVAPPAAGEKVPGTLAPGAPAPMPLADYLKSQGY
jgi:hypothetical protein